MREHNTPYHTHILLWPGIWTSIIDLWPYQKWIHHGLTFNIWGSGRALRLNAKRLNVCVIFDFSSQHLFYVFNAFSSFYRFHDKLQYTDCVYRCIYIRPHFESQIRLRRCESSFFSSIIFLPICVDVSVNLIRLPFPIQ